MLIKKYFYHELVNNSAKILAVLMLIMPITELFKILTQVIDGRVPKISVVILLLYGIIAAFPMILNIATFLAITITINRYSKDNELVIWCVSGISPMIWLKYTTVFILPITLFSGVCSMVISPWAVTHANSYTAFLVKQSASSAINEGVFNEALNNKIIYYIQKFSHDIGSAKNIFLYYTDESAVSYNITARSGNITNENGILNLTLYDVHRYQLSDDNRKPLSDISSRKFIATLEHGYDPTKDTPQSTAKNTSTLDLIKNINNQHYRSELSWRISIMLMTIVMAILAVPLSMQTGRIQSNLVFILPPAIYGIYQNIVMAIDVQINIGNFASAFATIPLHICIAVFGIALTYCRSK